ncbi:MAG: hypothetical protein EOM10_09770, partial [Opitutae bacterium]|nr:hypothetical protein [Opitutae bacterium]
ALVWHRSDDVTYSGQISGTGTLTKNGAGTLTLSGANTYSGNTTVSAGTLLVSGSAANSDVSVASGATLMGDGAIGALTVAGTVDPGNSTAARTTLACGALTLLDGGAMRVDISAASGTAGTEWDLITSSGAIAANATGTFTIQLHGTPTGFNAASSYSWKIMGGTSVSDFSAGRFAVDTNNFLSATSGGTFAVAQDGNDLVVTFTPGIPDAPGSLTATATGPDTIQLAFALNGNSTPVVIVYDLDGTFSDPSGSVPAAGEAFAGGTVVYAGDTSPQNHIDLDACDTYYYKAWSYNGTVYSTTGATDDEPTHGPDAPASVWASVTNYTDFTAAWDASDGATSYRIDVSEYEDFETGGGGGSETNLIISEMCDPNNNYSTDRYIEIFNAGSSAVDLTGWSVVAVGNGSDIFTWTLSGTIGSSNALTCGDSGNTQFTPDFTGGSWSGANTSWNGKDGDGAYLVKSGTTIDDASSHGNFENKTTVRDATVGTGVTVFASGEWTSTAVSDAGTGASTPGSHDCSSVPSGGGGGTAEPSYVAGYSNLLVSSGTSVSVTGLVEGTEYFFRVRADGVDGCASDHSPTGSVTTLVSGPTVYTLRSTGFEGTDDDNWSWVPSSLAAELGPRTDAITGKTGDYSLMLTGSESGNVDPTILFDNVTIPDNSENISLSVGYAASGADSGDDLYVAVSYDNGSTWETAVKLVDGNDNYSLDFGETDIADRTPTLANPYVLSIPDDTAQVRVKITYDEASGLDNRYDEYYIDEVKLVAGTDLPTVSWDAVRTVTNEDYTTQFSIPVTISEQADATVQVAIAGTALPGGTDFTAASTTLVFTAAGATTQNLQITINNDTAAEGVETVRFTLVLPEGVKIAGPDVHTLFIRDDDAFTIATANLVSGTVTVGDTTAYDDEGQRLLRALLPDIVAIQEWVLTNNAATFVSQNFGDEYDYYIEPEGDTYAQPNGVISRWPITSSGQWADGTGTGGRDYVWATINLPGDKDLNVVSVHFKAGDAESVTREDQAVEVTNYIANAGFDAGDYL